MDYYCSNRWYKVLLVCCEVIFEIGMELTLYTTRFHKSHRLTSDYFKKKIGRDEKVLVRSLGGLEDGGGLFCHGSFTHSANLLSCSWERDPWGTCRCFSDQSVLNP